MQEDLNSTDNALPFDMGNIGDALVTVTDSHSTHDHADMTTVHNNQTVPDMDQATNFMGSMRFQPADGTDAFAAIHSLLCDVPMEPETKDSRNLSVSLPSFNCCYICASLITSCRLLSRLKVWHLWVRIFSRLKGPGWMEAHIILISTRYLPFLNLTHSRAIARWANFCTAPTGP
jgi:hypothetical protein